MYVGIGKERGVIVDDELAFDYAFTCIERGTTEDKREFAEYMLSHLETNATEEMKEEFLEWFYSGNWVYEKGSVNDE